MQERYKRALILPDEFSLLCSSKTLYLRLTFAYYSIHEEEVITGVRNVSIV